MKDLFGFLIVGNVADSTFVPKRMKSESWDAKTRAGWRTVSIFSKVSLRSTLVPTWNPVPLRLPSPILFAGVVSVLSLVVSVLQRRIALLGSLRVIATL